MKKTLAFILSVVTLCLCLSFAASAGDWVFKESQRAAVVTNGLDSIVYKGEVYNKTDFYDSSLLDEMEDEGKRLDVVFENDKIRSKFSYFDVIQYEDCNYVLFAEYMAKNGNYFYEYYVKEAYCESVEAFLNDESVGGYKVGNLYSTDMFSFTSEQIEAWINLAGLITCDGADLEYDECYNLNAIDEQGHIYKTAGQILRKWTYEEADEFYIVRYADHDENFALGKPGVKTVLYKLEDEKLAKQLTEFFDTYPEDELDWMFGETPDLVIVILCSFFFGLLPAAAIVLSIIMMCVYKSKYSKNGYIVIIASSGVIIACFVALLLMVLLI